MKNIITTVALMLLLISCKKSPSSQEIDYKNQTVTVTGKITVPAHVPVIDQMMVYTFNEEINDFDEYKSDVDTQGNFKITLQLEKPRQVTLAGNSQLFLIAVPGDNIVVSFKDSGEPGAVAQDVKFTGDRAATNNKLQDYIKNRPLKPEALQEIYETQTARELTAYLQTNEPIFNSYVDKFIDQNDDDTYLTEYAIADKKLAILNTKFTLNAYGGNRQLPATDLIDLTTVLENLPDFVPADLINSTESEQYLYYVTSALTTKTKEALQENTTAEEGQKQFLKIINAIKGNELVKRKIIYRSAINDFESNGVSFFENNKEAIKTTLNDEALFTTLTDRYTATKKILENPVIPAGAKMLVFNTQDPSAYIEEIIANAAGKVIYIDNWATWCAPCKQEFKTASPQLHEKFKDQVEFVYLCHQSERKNYEPSIAKYKIAGKHYFLSQEESAPLFEQIRLQGFPTYTIIGKDGKIVISDYTHRPSYAGTTDILTKLINE